jgi:polysaccharide deacetylase family protein (PEP-CTERM system associated)
MSLTLLPERVHYGFGGKVNAMTVDVEDYFQVSAFEGQIGKDEWDRRDCRVERNTERILELFDESDVKASFYVLGWIAERFPALVRRIVDSGHELASHGYSHIRVVQQTPDQFRQDITRTKKLLEDVSGLQVLGYRAASYSIGSENLWALDVLEDTGYQYSSSIYPIKHDLYGMPEAPRFPFRLRERGILEIPVSTVMIWNRKIPCGGGGYFRLFPYAFSRWAIRRVNRHDQQPTVFYFHPWEIDPGQPRINGISMKTRFRHYLNLNRTEARLKRLILDFKWDRVDHVYSLV